MIKRVFSIACISALSFSTASVAGEDLRDVVRSSRGDVIINTYGNCVRTHWIEEQDICGPEPRKAVRRVTLDLEERTVYFDFNKFALTAQARQKLNSLAAELKSDTQVREAQIVGYADRIGTASYNQQLSKRRAENVRNYLVSRGFINSRVAETRWLGEGDPVTRCPDSLSRTELIQCLQRDRRVEVEIEYYPDDTPRKN